MNGKQETVVKEAVDVLDEVNPQVREKPIIPDGKWDYQASVERVRGILSKATKNKQYIVKELHVANTMFNSQGRRSDIKNCITPTWEQYCDDIGIDKGTANRWLREFRNPKVYEKVKARNIVKRELMKQQPSSQETPIENNVVNSTPQDTVKCKTCELEYTVVCQKIKDGTHRHIIQEGA
jgi:hypothetical protein